MSNRVVLAVSQTLAAKLNHGGVEAAVAGVRTPQHLGGVFGARRVVEQRPPRRKRQRATVADERGDAVEAKQTSSRVSGAGVVRDLGAGGPQRIRRQVDQLQFRRVQEEVHGEQSVAGEQESSQRHLLGEQVGG